MVMPRLKFKISNHKEDTFFYCSPVHKESLLSATHYSRLSWLSQE